MPTIDLGGSTVLRLFMAALAVSLTTDCALASDKHLGDKYLCIADKATGFHWTGSEWAQTTFKVDKGKYIIADLDLSERTDKHPIGVTILGKAHWDYLCSVNFITPVTLLCSSDLLNDYYPISMRVNLETLRYIKISSEGYEDGEDNNNYTPNIEIGRCSKI
jgi:hypothetical protein